MKKKTQKKNVPLPIDSNPVENKFVVGQEIIADEQKVVVSPQKQSKHFTDTTHLEEYKWKPGESGNPSGRSPDLVKSIAKRIAHLKAGKMLSEKELDKLKRLGLDQADITVIESIILDWATSGNPVKQQMYIERVAGKVPNININAEMSAAVVSKFRNKLTDAELERIGAGEDAMEILLEKLPDVPDVFRGQDDEDAIDASE